MWRRHTDTDCAGAPSHSAAANRCRVAIASQRRIAAIAGSSADRQPPDDRAQSSTIADGCPSAIANGYPSTIADGYSNAKSAAAVTNRAGCSAERELYSEWNSIAGAANRVGDCA